MKKIMFIPLLALLICLFAGCAADKAARPLSEVPTRSEYHEYVTTHTAEESTAYQAEIMDLIDSLTDEELRTVLEGQLTPWKDEQTLLKIDRISLTFTKDDLLMDENANKRKYANLNVKVGLYCTQVQVLHAWDDMDQAAQEVHATLREGLYGAFKINEIKVTGYSDGSYMYSHEFSLGLGPAARLSPEELRAQTIAYDFVQDFNQAEFSDPRYNPHGEVTLLRFGILPDTDELYIEMPIYTPGYRDDAQREAFTDSLKDWSADLFSRISQDADTMDYLDAQGVRTVTVSFNTLWEKRGQFFHTFSYELEP
ncbi:MAG: hypothetical protein VB086_13145 [Clostridiaceae bacterium]|nr:hypothetical protein [Clostridiaceae bacterium]